MNYEGAAIGRKRSWAWCRGVAVGRGSERVRLRIDSITTRSREVLSESRATSSRVSVSGSEVRSVEVRAASSPLDLGTERSEAPSESPGNVQSLSVGGTEVRRYGRSRSGHRPVPLISVRKGRRRLQRARATSSRSLLAVRRYRTVSGSLGNIQTLHRRGLVTGESR